jgi:hypothetical protein
MKLDVRIPIGALFALDGALLAIYSLVSNQAETVRKAGLNITLYWGLTMLVFGAVMLGSALRRRRA